MAEQGGLAIDSDNVIKAIQAFYDQSEDMHQINNYLTEVQRSAQGWSIGFSLLANENTYNDNIYFFASGILKYKVFHNWNDVLLNFESYRDGTINCMLRFMNKNIILNQLSLVIGTIVVRSCKETWPQPVHGLIEKFMPLFNDADNGMRAVNILLLILRAIPEQMNILNVKDQTHAKTILDPASPAVEELLESILANYDNHEIINSTIICLGLWYGNGMKPNLSTSLLTRVFTYLSLGEYFNSCCECIQNMLEKYSFALDISIPMRNILFYIGNLEQFVYKVIEEGDSDKITTITKMLVAAGENNLNLIIKDHLQALKHPNDHHDDMYVNAYIKLSYMILALGSVEGYYPVDECSSDMTFAYWHEIQDYLTMLESKDLALVLPLYMNQYEKLIHSMVKKLEYPTVNMESEWSSDDRESFRCYRQDIIDTMMNCYSLLKHVQVGYFKTIFTSYVRSKASWQKCEAIIYAMKSIIENLEPTDPSSVEFITFVFDGLQLLPCDNKLLINQIIEFTGSCYGFNSVLPEILKMTMGLVLENLLNKDTWISATFALKDIVTETPKDDIAEYNDKIFQYCIAFINQEQIPHRDKRRVMLILGISITNLRCIKSAEQRTIDILRQLTDPFTQIVGKRKTKENATNIICINHLLMNFVIGLQCFENNVPDETDFHPVKNIMNITLPIYKILALDYGDDTVIIKSIVDVIKKGIRALMNSFVPYIPITVEICSYQLPLDQHMYIIELVKNMVLMFCKEFPEVDALFKAVNKYTLAFFIDDEYKEMPDVLKVYYIYLFKIAKKTPEVFHCDHEDLFNMFHYGVLGISMQESIVVDATCNFLAHFIRIPENDLVRNLIEAYGGTMIENMYRALSGESPRNNVFKFASVINALYIHYYDHLATWLRLASQQVNFPNANITLEEKNSFTTTILKNGVSVKKIQQSLELFTLKWRNMENTDYARQTSRFPPPLLPTPVSLQ